MTSAAGVCQNTQSRTAGFLTRAGCRDDRVGRRRVERLARSPSGCGCASSLMAQERRKPAWGGLTMKGKRTRAERCTSSHEAEQAGPGCARRKSGYLNSEAKRPGLAALLGEELSLTTEWDRHGPRGQHLAKLLRGRFHSVFTAVLGGWPLYPHFTDVEIEAPKRNVISPRAHS